MTEIDKLREMYDWQVVEAREIVLAKDLQSRKDKLMLDEIEQELMQRGLGSPAEGISVGVDIGDFVTAPRYDKIAKILKEDK